MLKRAVVIQSLLENRRRALINMVGVNLANRCGFFYANFCVDYGLKISGKPVEMNSPIFNSPAQFSETLIKAVNKKMIVYMEALSYGGYPRITCKTLGILRSTDLYWSVPQIANIKIAHPIIMPPGFVKSSLLIEPDSIEVDRWLFSETKEAKEDTPEHAWYLPETPPKGQDLNLVEQDDEPSTFSDTTSAAAQQTYIRTSQSITGSSIKIMQSIFKRRIRLE